MNCQRTNGSFTSLTVTNPRILFVLPTGIMASMDLIPVCNGSVTGFVDGKQLLVLFLSDGISV
jgi:hypothetical protein